MDKPKFVREELRNEMLRVDSEMKELEVGSEQHLNAAKAQVQLAQARRESKVVEWNNLIPAFSGVAMYVIMMAFQQEHILDTRLIQNMMNLWRPGRR